MPHLKRIAFISLQISTLDAAAIHIGHYKILT
jgi:hypothetical protein